MDPGVFIEAVNRAKAMVAVRDHQSSVRFVPDQQERRQPLTGLDFHLALCNMGIAHPQQRQLRGAKNILGAEAFHREFPESLDQLRNQLLVE